MSDLSYDLIIIGAGPAGLACAIDAQRAGLATLIIDKGTVAHAIQRFQRDMFFFSTPELLQIGDLPFIVSTTRPTSRDCVNYYRKVAEYYQLKLHLFDAVTSVVKNGRRFDVLTSGGMEFDAGAVVVATGYYDCPCPLGVPGEDLPAVTHYYRDPMPHYGQRVLIVGGKNSAVEAALDLYRHGACVTVVHRGDTLSSGVKYWILPDFENRVKSGSIQLQLNTVVCSFHQGSALLQSAGGESRVQEFDQAFVLIGYRPDVKFLESLGIAVDHETLAPIFNPDTFETNIPGMFVAGGLVGGRFNNKVFIENGREHGKRIVQTLTR